MSSSSAPEASDAAPRRSGWRWGRWAAVLPWLPLVVVVALAAVAHLWGLRGDLPYAPDVDEPLFIRAAVRVASGHLSPGWYGHPGSTVIYPIAVLIRLWMAAINPASATHIALPGLAATLSGDPAPFYVLGRLVSAAYGIGSVVLTWLIARRLTGQLGALLAALVLPVTWIVVSYGQLVRDDSAGMFFALLCLLFLVRAITGSDRRDWLLAGATIGVAISTRYFLVSLAAPYVIAALVATPSSSQVDGRGGRRDRIARWAGLLAAPIGFVLTSPSVVFALPEVVRDLRLEARTVAPGADGLSPLGNLAWYIGSVLPPAVGLGLLALAVAGAIIGAQRAPRAILVLATFVVAYGIAVSLSPLHWDRYVIPVIPIVAILASIAITSLASWIATVAAAEPAHEGAGTHGVEPERPRRLRSGLASAIAIALALVVVSPAAQTVATQDRLRGFPTTRFYVTEWMNQTLPPGAMVCEEMYTAYATGATVNLYRVFALSDQSLEDYRARGCRYLISSSAMESRFTDTQRYPRESAFYASLGSMERLLRTFEPDPTSGGPVISVYQLE